MKIRINKQAQLALFCLVIILSSCEKDLYENQLPSHSAPFASKSLNINELPGHIQNFVEPRDINNTSRSNGISSELNDAIFITYDITSTTDDKKNTNYCIGFIYEDTPPNVFYNLIINVLSTGEQTQYILKYICKPSAFDNFKAHQFDFKYFDGITEMGAVTTANTKGKPSLVKRSGDDECPKILLPSPTNGNGSGGSGGVNVAAENSTGFNTTVLGYNVAAGSGITSVSIGGTTYYAGGGTSSGSSGHDHSSCYGSNGEYYYLLDDPLNPPHKHQQKMASNCPEQTTPSGYVPVNTVAENITYLKSLLVLNRYQLLFLTANPDILNLIYSNLLNSETTDQDKAIAISIIDGMRLNTDLKLDINASFKSPFNIDRLSINDATP